MKRILKSNLKNCRPSVVVLMCVIFLLCCAEFSNSQDESAQVKNIDGAYELYDHGEYQATLEYALDMIANNIQTVDAHIVAAESCLELGDVDNTILHYRKAIELDPENYQTMVGLGEVYFGSGKKEEAKEIFLAAIQKNPDAVELYNYVAHVYRDMGELDKAVETLEKAISIDPSFAEAYLNLGTSFIMMSEYIRAVEVLQKSIELDSLSYTAYNNLSLAYYRMGEYEKALEAIENAIKLSPGDPKVLKNLTYLAEEIEKIKPEYVEFETGAKEAPVEDIELVKDDGGKSWSLSEQDQTSADKKIYWEDSGQEAVVEKSIVDTSINSVESEPVADEAPVQLPVEKVAETVAQNESNEIDTAIVLDQTIADDPENISIETTEKLELNVAEIKLEEPHEVEAVVPEKVTNMLAVEKTIKDDRFVPYNPPKIDKLPKVEKIELPKFEGGLEPLPLPESGLSSGLETFDGEMFSFGGFPLIELAEKRKMLPGIFYFNDGDKMLWRYQPEKNAMQKIFKGIYPSCSSDGGRLLYVTWDLHSVRLYLYDFASSSRSILLTSDNFIKTPKFSPDGKYVAFMTVSSAYKNILEVISLSDLSRSVFNEIDDVNSYDWKPGSNTVVVVDDNCTVGNVSKKTDICLYEWNVVKKSVEATTLNFDKKADQQKYSIVGKKKIKFLPDGKNIMVYPAIDGYNEFYIVNLQNRSINNKYFTGTNGETLRLWNLSPGYADGLYTWSSMGTVWSSMGKDSSPFPAIIGHFVSGDIAWCCEPGASAK